MGTHCYITPPPPLPRPAATDPWELIPPPDAYGPQLPPEPPPMTAGRPPPPPRRDFHQYIATELPSERLLRSKKKVLPTARGSKMLCDMSVPRQSAEVASPLAKAFVPEQREHQRVGSSGIAVMSAESKAGQDISFELDSPTAAAGTPEKIDTEADRSTAGDVFTVGMMDSVRTARPDDYLSRRKSRRQWDIDVEPKQRGRAFAPSAVSAATSTEEADSEAFAIKPGAITRNMARDLASNMAGFAPCGAETVGASPAQRQYFGTASAQSTALHSDSTGARDSSPAGFAFETLPDQSTNRYIRPHPPLMNEDVAPETVRRLDAERNMRHERMKTDTVGARLSLSRQESPDIVSRRSPRRPAVSLRTSPRGGGVMSAGFGASFRALSSSSSSATSFQMALSGKAADLVVSEASPTPPVMQQMHGSGRCFFARLAV